MTEGYEGRRNDTGGYAAFQTDYSRTLSRVVASCAKTRCGAGRHNSRAPLLLLPPQKLRFCEDPIYGVTAPLEKGRPLQTHAVLQL